MSRRWYRYADKVVFFGWEPADQAFYMNVVDLCVDCGGSGEVADTEEVCPGCGGEGIQLQKMSPSSRRGGFSLDALVKAFERESLPMPSHIVADLEADQKSNAGTVLQEYEIA